MATIYNKTALNKVKKADLIDLFLQQQAEKNQLVLDAEEMNQKGWLEIAKREEEFKKLKEQNEKLKEKTAEHLGMAETLHDAVVEENKKLKEENEKLKAHMIYMGQNKMKADLKKLKQELIKEKEENVELMEENKKLKEDNDEWESEYCRVESNAESLEYDNDKLKQQNDFAYKQINELMSKVKLLTQEIEKLKESDSESDEECDQCVCCEVKFDQHEARYNMGEDLRLKYEKYFGSEKDDGDICPECLNHISD